MRAVIQRSKQAFVTVNGHETGRIEQGLVILIGVTHGDTEQDARYLADKIANLRIFEDEHGKMNLSILETGGQILSISQFTLYGDCSKGRRPNYMNAARPEPASLLYDKCNEILRQFGILVETGVFGEMMDVSLCNWGPVTLLIDSTN